MATTNKYPGKCCYCGHPVAPYEGVLVKLSGKFVPAHTGCDATRFEPDPIDTLYEDNCRDACGL
jgi:hypothetical protein